MTFEEAREMARLDPMGFASSSAQKAACWAAVIERIEDNSRLIKDLRTAIEQVVGLCEINHNLSLAIKRGIIQVSHEIETQLTALQSDLAALSYKPGPSGPFCNN